MAEGRLIEHVGEALVLRSWPFQEADLLVSLFTRDGGRIKGVARHAMRSRRRFGGALEPMTHVRARYAERPKQELVRLDAFDILWSPMRDPIDYQRTAGVELLAEVLEEALPEQAADDDVFRLALATLEQMQVGRVLLPVTYFCLWMSRLMGWMPELGHCVVCGLDLRGGTVWYSPTSDGVTCDDDRRPGSVGLAAHEVAMAWQIFRSPLRDLAGSSGESSPGHTAGLRRFALATLQRHLDRRLRSAAALG